MKKIHCIRAHGIIVENSEDANRVEWHKCILARIITVSVICFALGIGGFPG